MLHKITSDSLDEFFLWTNVRQVSESSSTFDLFVINGTVIWERLNLTIGDVKPPSILEREDDYFPTLLSVLENTQQFEYGLVRLATTLTMTVKHASAGSKVKLFEAQLSEADSFGSKMMIVLCDISTEMQRQRREIDNLRTEAEVRNNAISNLRQDLERSTDIKEKLQDHMLQKMCILLNAKKRMIDRIRNEVDQDVRVADCGVSTKLEAIESAEFMKLERTSKPVATAVNRKRAAASGGGEILSQQKPAFLDQAGIEIDGTEMEKYLTQEITTESYTGSSKAKVPSFNVKKEEPSFDRKPIQLSTKCGTNPNSVAASHSDAKVNTEVSSAYASKTKKVSKLKAGMGADSDSDDDYQDRTRYKAQKTSSSSAPDLDDFLL